MSTNREAALDSIGSAVHGDRPKVYAMLAIADAIEGLTSTLRDALAVPPSVSRCTGCGTSAVDSDEMCSACLAGGAL